MINESKEEVEYLMSKFYEYRILASEAGANGSDDEYKKFSEQAMEYYERAIAEMDADAADMTDHLSDEDKALPNKPLDEKKTNNINNKMENINLNRWSKLAGITENDNNAPVIKGNEDWEGSINQLGNEEYSQGFGAEMRDIILAKYPEEGGSTCRMEIYYNNDNEPTGTNGGFAIDNGSVYFAFKFKDGKVVDYSFDEQKY